MVIVAYQIRNEVVKTYVGDIFYGILFRGQIILSNLTMADRLALNLPTRKLNPDFNESKIETDGNQRWLPLTAEDTIEMIPIEQLIPPHESEATIRQTIIDRMEMIVREYEQKTHQVQTTSIELESNGVFTEN